MTATVVPRHRSSSGDNHELRVGYIVEGATSEDDAINATWNAAPRWFPMGGAANAADRNTRRYLMNISVEEIDLSDDTRVAQTGTFFTWAIYQHKAVCPIPSFDTSLETEKIYSSLQTISTTTRQTTPTQTAADYGGAINIDTSNNTTKVEGTDRFANSTKLTMVWHPEPWPISGLYVDEYYDLRIQRMIPRVNSTIFLKSFAIGEVLFAGYNSRLIDQRSEQWELNFTYYIRTNRTNVIIDGITIPAVGAWHYVWGPREYTQAQTTSPAKDFINNHYNQLKVERIYETADLNHAFYNQAGACLVVNCPRFAGIPASISPGLFPQLPVSS